MFRFWSAVAAAVVTLVAVAAAAWYRPALLPAPPPAHPVLACPSGINIGVVERNTLAEGRFTIANAGGGELVLSEFRSDCVCEGVEQEVDGQFFRFQDIRLPAGASTVLRYQRSTDGPVGGPVRSPVWFKTTDPAVPEALVVVTIERIVGGITASPASVALGSVPVGPAQQRTVELTDTATPPRRIDRAISSDPDRVTVTLLPPDPTAPPPAGAEASHPIGRLAVQVAADRPGEIDARVTLFVAGRTTPDTVRVTGRVVAPVEVTPAELHLPRASSAGPIYAADVLVLCPADASAVVECPSPPTGVVVTVHLSAGPVRRVTVAADPKRVGGECVVPLSVRVGAVTHSVSVRVHCTTPGGRP